MHQNQHSIKKVLIIRFSSIGDIVLTTPVIRCIKQQTGAEVHYLTKPGFAGILEHNPYIDRLFLLSNSIQQSIKELKKENYDLVIDLHKNIRSYLISFALRKQTIRFDKLNYEKWLMVRFKKDKLPRDKHLVDRYFDELTSIGIRNDGLGLDYFITKQDDFAAKELVPDVPFQALVMGATYYTKRIPDVKCRDIITKYKYPTVLLGGKDVSDQAKQLSADFSEKVINLCGQVSLGVSAGIIKYSTRVVSGDTGLMHIAAALQKPLIVFWGNTIPGFGMYPYYGKNNRPLHINLEVKNLYCRPCSKLGFDHCPEKHFRCMMDQKIPE